MTILLTPYMSCSAKIPIYAFFTAAFFPRHRALVMISLYVLGVAIGIVVALILKSTLFRGKPVPFVMELPNYRFPTLKNVGLLVWDKVKDFLQRAFSIIFLATVIVWFLESFDPRLNPVSDNSQSLLAIAGQALTPLFAPLGLGDWRLVASLFTGFISKESVVSSLTVLCNGGAITGILSTQAQAVSFLVFSLLYTPCVAAIAAVRRELHSAWQAAGVVVMQCLMAWGVTYVVYGYTHLFTQSSALGALDLAILAAVGIWIVFALATLLFRKKQGKSLSCGGDCAHCAAACEKRTEQTRESLHK